MLLRAMLAEGVNGSVGVEWAHRFWVVTWGCSILNIFGLIKEGNLYRP